MGGGEGVFVLQEQNMGLTKLISFYLLDKSPEKFIIKKKNIKIYSIQFKMLARVECFVFIIG